MSEFTPGRLSQLEAQAWPQVTASTLLIPVGSTEQHGPHLPLATDTHIAQALANRAVRDAGDQTLAIGPAISISASGEHQGFPGTLSVGTEVLSLMLVEVVRSAMLWAKRVVFVNGHGGNGAAFTAAAKVWTHERRNVVVWVPTLPTDGDWHAGHVETSVMMFVHPELVGPIPAVGHTDQSSATAVRMRAHGVGGVSESGVLGDPTSASEGAGRAIFDLWSADLLATLQSAMPT